MTDAELAALDLAVAKAEGWAVIDGCDSEGSPSVGMTGRGDMRIYKPTRDPVEAMRLLEKYRLGLDTSNDDPPLWLCGYMYPGDDGFPGYDQTEGETPCIAIAKATVALAGRK